MAAPARPQARPLSPHLSIWKWRVTMLVSILHRATGSALAFGAVVLFLWWLIAAATGPEAYATFHAVATGPFGLFVGIGLSWVFFQHLMSGVRHLVMDAGAVLEIEANKRFATFTLIGSAVLTIALWAWLFAGKGIV